MTGDPRLLGAWGETHTADYLRRRGYTLRAANYRTRHGEIDIIAEKDGILALVEVKTRRDDRFAKPMEAVTPAKLAKIRLAGLAYLAETGCDLPVRFDVAEVYAPQDLTKPPVRIHYMENVSSF